MDSEKCLYAIKVTNQISKPVTFTKFNSLCKIQNDQKKKKITTVIFLVLNDVTGHLVLHKLGVYARPAQMLLSLKGLKIY